MRRLLLAILSSLSLLVLILSPASAAPALAVGSRAAYNLSGALEFTAACTADPAQYAPQACGGGGSVSTYGVYWVDDGLCSPSSNNTGACRFSPSVLGIPTGSTVQWSHIGSLTHTATANVTANNGLPPFDSGPIPQGAIFTNTFSTPGAYQYYCSVHPWMKGTINVSGPPPPPPPPMPMTFRVNFDGNVGWTVEGLSPDVANLKVDHKVAVSISPQPGVTFTPLVEQGSFPQSIALATRVESPGTATSIIQSLLKSIPNYYPYGYYPVRPIGTLTPTTTISSMATLTGDPHDPLYTAWWVNGPLSLGSPVQILTGQSSVTGDENLNLGTALGTRAGWVATSQFAQSANATSPNGPTSHVAFQLNLLWSFDKRGDVLLRSSADAAATIIGVGSTQIYTNPCAPSGYCPTYVPVTVTRTETVSLSLALRLASTNLNLNNRSRASTQSSPLDTLASLPLLPFGAAGAVAAAIVGTGVWYTRRTRGKTIEPAAIPVFPS